MAEADMILSLVQAGGLPVSAAAFWYYIHTKDKRHSIEREQWTNTIKNLQDKQDEKNTRQIELQTEMVTLLRSMQK